MSDVKCARMLLGTAGRSMKSFRAMRHSNEVSDEVLGFHVQQAAETLFKVWIALLGEVYPLTHDIEVFLDFLADRGAAIEPFHDLINYSPYAVRFRYAGVDAGTDPINREGAFKIVETLLEQVRQQLAEVERT